VHDYHLIPFAASLRRSNVRSKIGFFLHIPFPPPEIFAAVPDHKKLARCLFAYDLVGFQTLRDRENFIRYAQEHCGARLTPEGDLKVSGRTVKVEAFPIGIDVVQFATEARRNASHPDLAGLTESNFKRIIGVDRLDYSKGLPERLMAIESLFDISPEYRGAVQYLQIATPTREGISAYDDIDAELDRIIGQVNGRFGTFGWSPVSYIKRPTPQKSSGRAAAALPRRAHLAPARRHEPGGQGVCGGAGSTGPGRSHPVAVRRRGGTAQGGADRQSLRFRGAGRRHPQGAGDAQGRAPGAPRHAARQDQGGGHRLVATAVSRCADRRTAAGGGGGAQALRHGRELAGCV
jgi:hypothetical protein